MVVGELVAAAVVDEVVVGLVKLVVVSETVMDKCMNTTEKLKAELKSVSDFLVKIHFPPSNKTSH